MGNGASSRRAARTGRGPRDRNRKDKIIRAARELFREQGYHAVGIDEIGEAAGITGPGVYRHFGGKQDLLTAALRGAAEELWQGTEGHEHDPPDQALERFLRSHIEFTVRNTDIVTLWYQEYRNLPRDARAEQRRLQRAFVDNWVAALQNVRPDLDADEARVRVQATIGLIHSIAVYEPGLEPARLADVLFTTGYAALDA